MKPAAPPGKQPLSKTAEQDWYRPVIILVGMCGLFAALGIGRFALGMLLPAMGEALALGYTQMGVIGTVNFCGYLAAVLLCGRMSRMFGLRLLIFLALLLVGASMVLIGMIERVGVIMLLYCLTGIGSAWANIPIMALVAAWFPPEVRGRASGMVVVGNGLGIVMAGHLVPLLNNSATGWRLSWLVLGSIALLMAGICGLFARNRSTDGSLPDKRAETKQTASYRAHDARLRGLVKRCAALYFLFGSTYVIYLTFLVTSLVQERGFTEESAGALWSVVGILSLGSGPLFGWFSDRFGRKRGLFLVFCIQATAYVSAMAVLPLPFLYLSIVCFGIVAWSIPSIMAALIGDFAGPERTAALFGLVTFVFGIGQILGPYGAGVLAEISGGFSVSFLLAAVLASLAAILALRLPLEEKTAPLFR
ncbi:MFS transporter [Desulfofustis limnaeus]|uniref:MFS transporter n=1 Tax=Desulfofustis limnaeus TaxID=2740163 RepID=A0ABM7WC58_9BACT|nr:MFS transporter [Desulfofustis limnaeus]BDD88586.1 MFS transporter [Desulfofustis limnaeus]